MLLFVQASLSRKEEAQMKGALPRLFRDCAAVLSGLRPGFMLDYASPQPAHLSLLVAAISRALEPLLGPCAPCVAELEGCCYVLRPELLPGGERALAAAPPRLISFSSAGGGLATTQWAAGPEAEAAHRQLLSAAAQLRDLVAAAAQRAAAAAPGRPPPPRLPVVPLVSLSELRDAPVMPTLSGLLLGYPAVYLVHSMDSAQAAARALSSAALRMHSLDCGLAGAEQAPGAGPLLSFSVPEELLRGEGAAAEAWREALRGWQAGVAARAAAARAAGVPWGTLRLEQGMQQPRPVAL